LVLPGAWKARSTRADHSPITLFSVDCERRAMVGQTGQAGRQEHR
jgi:hypothetical protein